MVKTLLTLTLLCLVALPASAQQTQSKVTGTIVDPNSVPYYPATVLACLTPAVTNPTVAGAAISTNPGAPYCVGPAQTGLDGTFQIPLYANSVIQCNNVACSTQWQFTVTASGTAPPAGKGAQNFQVVTTISNLTAQDLSVVLTGAAPILLNSGGGGGSVGPGTPQNVGCFSTTTNLQNCPDPITDTPGVGVNIPTNVTIGGGTGAATLGLPSGDPSTCNPPVAGQDFWCADSISGTFDYSYEGAPYLPLVPPISGSGAPSGSCVAGQIYTDTITRNIWSCNGTSWGTTYVATTSNINSPQFLKSPLSGPNFNSVIYADGFAVFGGTYRGTWSSAVAYNAFDTVTFSGVDYITPTGNVNISPATVFSPGSTFFWIKYNNTGIGATIPANATATTADKAFFWAYYLVQLNSTSFSINEGVDVEFGDLTGGYTKNGDWALPVNTEGYTISMHGKGRGMTYINQGVTTLNYMVSDTSASASLGRTFDGITFNANQLAGGCVSVHSRRSYYNDLVCFNPQQQGGGSIQYAMWLGTSGDSYEVHISHIFVRGVAYVGLNGAYGTCPVSAGAINFASCTITNGGTSLDLPVSAGPGLVAYINGNNNGTSHQPCTSMPNQPTFTLTSGVLTGLTAGASAGSGCGGTVYFQVWPAGTLNYAYNIGVTDSTIDDLVSTGDFQTACARMLNGFNAFNHPHIYCRAPVQIIDLGRNVYTDVQTDTPAGFGLDLQGAQTEVTSSTTEWAVTTNLGAAETLIESGATGVHMGSANCATGLQSGGGYAKYTVKNVGPVTGSSHNLPAGFRVSGTQPFCDGSGSLWGSYPTPPLDSTSVSSVVDDFINGGTTSNTIGILGWSTANLNSGAPTVTLLPGTATHPGIVSLATSTTSGQGYFLFLGGNAASQALPLSTIANWAGQWISTTTDITSQSFRQGFTAGASATTPFTTNGYFFRFDTALSDTQIMACSSISSTETCVTTGVTPVGNTYHDFYIWSDAAGIIKFQVDTGTVLTACIAATASCSIVPTTLPTSTLIPMTTMVTQTTAAKTVLLDYFKYTQQGLVR